MLEHGYHRNTFMYDYKIFPVVMLKINIVQISGDTDKTGVLNMRCLEGVKLFCASGFMDISCSNLCFWNRRLKILRIPFF